MQRYLSTVPHAFINWDNSHTAMRFYLSYLLLSKVNKPQQRPEVSKCYFFLSNFLQLPFTSCWHLCLTLGQKKKTLLKNNEVLFMESIKKSIDCFFIPKLKAFSIVYQNECIDPTQFLNTCLWDLYMYFSTLFGLSTCYCLWYIFLFGTQI